MENEKTFIRIYPLLSDIELADYYGVEVDSIQKRAKELGLKKDPRLTKYEAKEEEGVNKKIMDQPPTNKSGARKKKLSTIWEIAQQNTLMEAYAGELVKFDYQDKDILLCMSVFQNNINKSEII